MVYILRNYFYLGHHAYNASFLAGHFQNGCLHGLIKGFEYVPIDGVKGDPSYEDPNIDYIAVYKNGYPNSNLWKIIISPDGIILGYFYIEEPQISAKPNLDIELQRYVEYIICVFKAALKESF